MFGGGGGEPGVWFPVAGSHVGGRQEVALPVW